MKRTAVLATFSVLILVARVFGQGDAANSEIESSTNYFRSEGGSGSAIHRQSSSQYPQQTHNVNEAERQRLRIEWGEAGYVRRVWANNFSYWTNCDPFDAARAIGIRGTMVLESPNGGTNQPISWMQGIRVVVARSPETRPDWSQFHDSKDALWDDCMLEKGGSFIATFDPEAIQRPVGRTDQFQVVVCLASKFVQTITWSNAVPVLPQLVTMVGIPGPKPISPTLQIINGAPSPFDREYNPVPLIRAVNHLQALGKDQAIAALREFSRISRDFSPFRNWPSKRDPANIDTSDSMSVFYLVRLLFLPASTNEMPACFKQAMEHSLKGVDKTLWPMFPLCLQADIPFLLRERIFGWHHPRDLTDILNWAEKEGQFRSGPLRPGNDPVLAADQLYRRRGVARLPEFDWYRDPLFEQAYRMVQHLGYRPADTIRWSEERQEYVGK